MSNNTKGAVLAIFGGSCWGISGCVGKYLFTCQGMDSAWLVPIRLFLAGVLLCGYYLTRDRVQFLASWREKRNIRDLLIYGIAGVSCCQFTYFLTIQLSTAGMATILQDVSPVIILAVACVSARIPKRPNGRKADKEIQVEISPEPWRFLDFVETRLHKIFRPFPVTKRAANR